MSGIIVTGATGFLGGALSRRLLRDGRQVIALGRDREKLRSLAALGAQTHAFDLSGLYPDKIELPATALVHCAALSSPWGRRSDFERANIAGTQGAIALAYKAQVRRFIHISSPSVSFRFADQENVREDADLPSPVNAYAATKAAGERLVLQETGLDPVILRPRGLYGPGDTALLPRLLRVAAKRPLPLMRAGKAATDLTYIDDAVDAIIAALMAASPVSRIYNVSGGETLAIKTIAECAGQKAGIKIRWQSLPWPLVKAAAHLNEAACAMLPHRPEPAITAYSAGLFAFRQTLCLDRVGNEIGWRPQISFEEGLERSFREGAA